MSDSSLQIRFYDNNPSAEEFVSLIEANNVPAVFRGCVMNWKAYAKWNPRNGGLHYLQEKVGSLNVEAMLSTSAPIFNGDIRSHERVPLPFSTFIGYCNHLQLKSLGLVQSFAEQSTFMHNQALHQIYLAQVPILNTENEEKVQLGCLREDIQSPPFLETKELAAINLWMNSVETRSSTHYDPHHNLLCIVAGCKQGKNEKVKPLWSAVVCDSNCESAFWLQFVDLWPPTAMPVLYPQPIYGEASNHSSISIESPDLSLYPKAQHARDFSQKLTLHAGDALFIPEGWFHQVNSDCLTIAVNFWWQSGIMSAMVSHMDAYYLRRILSRLTGHEMNQMLRLSSVTQLSGSSLLSEHRNGSTDCGINHSDLEPSGMQTKGNMLCPELDPLAVQSLGKLISLVYEHVDNIGPVSSTTEDDAVVAENNATKNFVNESSCNLVDDQIANFIWNLDPLILQSILLAMAVSS
ncbi:protein modifying enzyme [Lithospermum erythrorhizon]|uniref:Protein modifying enzyme n=1 Tax=Lithospermum erythrorhizon TaxID=34254 RepID=A0AAV3RH57_LITER